MSPRRAPASFSTRMGPWHRGPSRWGSGDEAGAVSIRPNRPRTTRVTRGGGTVSVSKGS